MAAAFIWEGMEGFMGLLQGWGFFRRLGTASMDCRASDEATGQGMPTRPPTGHERGRAGVQWRDTMS
ncbi:hypothetical protein MFUL124B02_41955 [Myxococcus fulvus 124B02]|nr:hypothetical protein MFUL124B02_41955 [Myxococcus fulvus 124B02]